MAKDVSSTPVLLISQIQWEPFGSAVRSWQWHMASSLVPHERVFDLSGRMVRYPMGAVARDVTYDPAGRITAYTHHNIANGSAQTDWDQSFGYDAMGRIKGVSINGGTSSWGYGYDDNGNRKQVTVGSAVTNYTIDASSNRVNSATNPARTWTYADGAGNTTADTGGSSTGYSATYDLAGRLATLTRGGVTTTYTYDGLGRRVRKVSSTGAASTVLFAYDQQGQLIGEYSNTGAVIREYVWLGSTPIAILTPDSAAPTGEPIAYIVHADHLDAPRVVIDKNNARRWRWIQAEPFGTSAPETNPEGLQSTELRPGLIEFSL